MSMTTYLDLYLDKISLLREFYQNNPMTTGDDLSSLMDALECVPSYEGSYDGCARMFYSLGHRLFSLEELSKHWSTKLPEGQVLSTKQYLQSLMINAHHYANMRKGSGDHECKEAWDIILCIATLV